MKKFFEYLIGLVLLVSLLVSAAPLAGANPQTGVGEVLASAELSTRATGGPDAFGYIWDDGVTINWIHAAEEDNNSGLSGHNVYSGPVEIGFSFPFYENVYSELYLSTYGLISLGVEPEYHYNYQYKNFPDPDLPNNIIAPLWDNYVVNMEGYNEGGIYTLQGGSGTERFFVIEWHEISIWNTELYTFQIILHENGDIVMQYLEIPTGWKQPRIGIENSTGSDGLQYIIQDYNNLPQAIKFERPDPSRRIDLTPLYQSGFANENYVDFELSLRNIGDLRTDTYTIEVNSDWPAALFETDGETPIVSPVTIAQGDTQAMIARVTTPAGAVIGDENSVFITVTSSDPTVTKTATIDSAVPAQFAQVFVDGQVSTYLVGPDAQPKVDIPGTTASTSDIAILTLPNGNLLYAWSQQKYIPPASGWMIHYCILDRAGEVVLSPRLLYDLTGFEGQLSDFNPNLAVTPDGTIGVLWERRDSDASSDPYVYNYHLRFVRMDIDGNILSDHFNITGDEDWHNHEEPGSALYYRPNIIATGDGHFVVSWIRYLSEGDYVFLYDIFYTILNENGSIVTALTVLTDDLPDAYTLDHMTMCALAGNRVFIAWYDFGDLTVKYAVLDSFGSEVKAITSLGERFISLDVTQLSDGTILLAGQILEINYVLINGSTYEMLGSLSILPDPLESNDNKYVSVTNTGQAQGILTYQTRSPVTGKEHIMYALIASDGTLVTNPIPFHTAYSGVLSVSRYGNSNTTYQYNYAPYFTSEPVKEATQGAPYTYLITAEDRDMGIGDILTITSSVTLPDWLNIVDNGDGTATLSGTPRNGDVDSYPITLVVTDSKGLFDAQSFAIVVENVNDSPEFTSNPVLSAEEGSLYEYQITADDPDLIHGDKLTFSTPTLPTWLELTDNEDGTAMLFGTPLREHVGENSVVLQVTDLEWAFATQLFKIVVALTTEPPEITSDDTTTFTVGEPGTFTVITTGEPTPDQITHTGALPSGVTFTNNNNGTATLAGTPDIGTGGIYAITITASNGVEPDATQAFTMIVQTVEEIGDECGTITSDDASVEIVVQAGAVMGEATFTLVPQTEPSQDTGSYTFAGTSFTLTAEDGESNPIIEFAEPLIITITYDLEALGEIDPDTLKLYKWDGSAWLDAICEGEDYERGVDRFSLPICHLCEFAVMGEVPPTGFNIFLPLILR